MDPCDPRTWPAELIAARNLAMSAALGDRVDPEARAALASWPQHPQPAVYRAADRYTTGGRRA